MGTEWVRPGGSCSGSARLTRLPITRRTFRGLPFGRGSGAKGVSEMQMQDERTDAELFLAETDAALAWPHFMSALMVRLPAGDAGGRGEGALVRHGQPKRQLHGKRSSLNGSMCVGNLPFSDSLAIPRRACTKISSLPHVQ